MRGKGERELKGQQSRPARLAGVVHRWRDFEKGGGPSTKTRKEKRTSLPKKERRINAGRQGDKQGFCGGNALPLGPLGCRGSGGET